MKGLTVPPTIVVEITRVRKDGRPDACVALCQQVRQKGSDFLLNLFNISVHMASPCKAICLVLWLSFSFPYLLLE